MDSAFSIKSCAMFFLGLLVQSCYMTDNYLPKEAQIWTYKKVVSNRTYYTVRVSVNDSRLPVPQDLLKIKDSIYSLSIYIRSLRKSLDFVSLSDWDGQFSGLHELSLIHYGGFSIMFIRLFKSNISFLDVDLTLHPLFPDKYQFEKLHHITIKSKALANNNLSQWLPSLKTFVVWVDYQFPNLTRFLQLQSLILAFRRSFPVPQRVELRKLSELTELHILAVPFKNKPVIALIELPRLMRINITVIWLDDNHDMFNDDWTLSCHKLSGNLQEIRLLLVNLELLRRCPEIVRCDACGPELAQFLSLELPFTDKKAPVFFQDILPPDFAVFNTTELSLINVPVVFDNASFARFPFLEVVKIHLSYLRIFENLGMIFRGFPFDGILQSPDPKRRISIYFSQNCHEIIDIVDQFDTLNRSAILDVRCSFNSVFYNNRSLMLARHLFSSVGSDHRKADQVLVICSILAAVVYSIYLSSTGFN